MTKLFQLFCWATYALLTFGIIFIQTLQITKLGDNIHSLQKGRLSSFRFKLILLLCDFIYGDT